MLVVEFCVAGFKYPGFLLKDRGNGGVPVLNDTGGDASPSPSAVTELTDYQMEIASVLGVTEEQLLDALNDPVEVTPDNSPGNPAFLDLSFTEEEYAAAKTLTAPVSRENPTADFPVFGIHVDLKWWNLESEEDTLIVRRMPTKTDSLSGSTLYTYDYSLASGQNSFPSFYPANAGQAAESSPLVLKANKENKVLLETTVYHYLRFDCPTEVSVKGEKQSVDGRAEWTRRNLVTDVNTGQVLSVMEKEIMWLGAVDFWEAYRKEFDRLQTSALDTKIPVSFELEEDEEEGAGQNEDKTGSAEQTGTAGKEKTGYWKLADPKALEEPHEATNPWSEESDALMNNIYKDATLSGSAAEGFTGTSTYLGDDYRLGVSEKERTHEGHCTGEKGTAVTTFSQPPSILKPEEVLSVDVKVSYSKSDGHPQGVNLQTTVRFMWEPHASSYTYLRTDDDQYNIMPQQEHTAEGSKETGYHTYSSYSKNNEATLKGTVPKGNTGSQSDLYICFSGTLSAYQINTYYHYVWVEE